MRLSIGMCTYNGEKWLPEQLASIVGQTRPPDEVVITDDRSKDGTWEILQRFQREAPFDVKIVQNEQNLGSTANCEKALSLCTGDVLLLSDQDDVWLPGKLAAMERAFAANPNATVVIGDCIVVKEDLTPMGYTMFEAHSYTDELKRQMSVDPIRVLTHQNFATAGGMAFRAETRSDVFPCSRKWIHDGWIALLAAMKGDVVTIPEKMMLYRQHGRNQVGAGHASPMRQTWTNFKNRFRDQRPLWRERGEYWAVALERLEPLAKGADPVRAAAVADLREKVAHLKARGALPASRAARMKPIRAELATGRYARFSGGAVSALKDLVM